MASHRLHVFVPGPVVFAPANPFSQGAVGANLLQLPADITKIYDPQTGSFMASNAQSLESLLELRSIPVRTSLAPLHDEIAAALEASTMTTVWQRLRDDGCTAGRSGSSRAIRSTSDEGDLWYLVETGALEYAKYDREAPMSLDEYLNEVNEILAEAFAERN